VRSRDDIARAVRELTPAHWIRLKRSAAFWALGRPISAKDLLQEAFARAMLGISAYNLIRTPKPFR
jgi:DNA-directed RNA polymerase specialized sigma24 family protein